MLVPLYEAAGTTGATVATEDNDIVWTNTHGGVDDGGDLQEAAVREAYAEAAAQWSTVYLAQDEDAYFTGDGADEFLMVESPITSADDAVKGWWLGYGCVPFRTEADARAADYGSLIDRFGFQDWHS